MTLDLNWVREVFADRLDRGSDRLVVTTGTTNGAEYRATIAVDEFAALFGNSAADDPATEDPVAALEAEDNAARYVDPETGDFVEAGTPDAVVQVVNLGYGGMLGELRERAAAAAEGEIENFWPDRAEPPMPGEPPVPDVANPQPTPPPTPPRRA